MVEIPSAALLAHQMLEVVDFLSIGTNDLTQYTMAADRMATDLAHLTDAWQPAVLQLIAITAEAGKQAGKPVGVCGEAAADPMLATALVGMGITSLSMALAAVRPVGCAARRGHHGHLRAGRRGRARRGRPDGRPRRGPRRPGRLTSRPSTGQRGETVTGTPESTALPETSSTDGVGEVVHRDAGQRRPRARRRTPSRAVPVAVGQADHARHHVVAGLHLDLDRADRRLHAHDGAVGDRRGRRGRRGACSSWCRGAALGEPRRCCASRSCCRAGAAGRPAAARRGARRPRRAGPGRRAPGRARRARACPASSAAPAGRARARRGRPGRAAAWRTDSRDGVGAQQQVDGPGRGDPDPAPPRPAASSAAASSPVSRRVRSTISR